MLAPNTVVIPLRQFGSRHLFRFNSQNELSSPIAANLGPTISLAYIFIFMLFFYLLVYVN